MQNIVMMYKRDIGNKIYSQMLQHFYCENGFLQEEVVGTRNYNLQQSYTFSERVNLYATYAEKIQSVLFDGIKRGVFSTAKFDSMPELVLARVLENDGDVQNWLRPAPREFNITYNRGSHYEPDFVVETETSSISLRLRAKINSTTRMLWPRKSVVSSIAKLPLVGERLMDIRNGSIYLFRHRKLCQTHRFYN